MGTESKMDIRQMITREDMTGKVKAGEKTAVRRQKRFADVGETFDIDGMTYEITDVYQQQLGDVTEEDAKKEGFENLEAYKNSITSIHENAVWVPKLIVWVHEFKAK